MRILQLSLSLIVSTKGAILKKMGPKLTNKQEYILLVTIFRCGCVFLSSIYISSTVYLGLTENKIQCVLDYECNSMAH